MKAFKRFIFWTVVIGGLYLIIWNFTPTPPLPPRDPNIDQKIMASASPEPGVPTDLPRYQPNKK